MRTGNNDFKYVLQDTTNLYVGAKYTYEEALETEDMPFKLKAIIMQYILKDADADLTMEEHVKQMKTEDMSFLLFKQLKVKVKTAKKVYRIAEFIDLIEKEQNADHYFIEEIMISKLSLMAFSV